MQLDRFWNPVKQKYQLKKSNENKKQQILQEPTLKEITHARCLINFFYWLNLLNKVNWSQLLCVSFPQARWAVWHGASTKQKSRLLHLPQRWLVLWALLSVPGEPHSQNPFCYVQDCYKPVLQTGMFSVALCTDIFGSSIKSGANKGFLVVIRFVYG